MGKSKDKLTQQKVNQTLESVLEDLRFSKTPFLTGLSKENYSVYEQLVLKVFETGMNVKTIKADLGIRDNDISTRFRKAFNLGIKQLIQMIRMETAARLLEQDSFAIFFISKAVGYEYEQTFSRAFQRTFGMPPGMAQGEKLTCIPESCQSFEGAYRLATARRKLVK